jgi:gluconolactonase
VVTVLADRYNGKRLNSPNDLVYRSDGSLYFTDPPFGLPKAFDDPRRELPFSGVFRLVNGRLQLLATDLNGPNGLAFSPDERYLYVTNWDPARKVVMRYDVQRDGALAEGRVFFDMTSAPGEEALDGMKVDCSGTLFVSGPGGVWVISADGRHLGTIRVPELPANMAWGDADGRTLYFTARTGVYRMRLGGSVVYTGMCPARQDSARKAGRSGDGSDPAQPATRARHLSRRPGPRLRRHAHGRQPIQGPAAQPRGSVARSRPA